MSEPEELASVKDQATGDKDEKNVKSQADDSEKEEVDVEIDNEQRDEDVTQTAAQELVSAPRNAKTVKVEPIELREHTTGELDRPNTANSFSSGTSADSIPPLPPLPPTTSTSTSSLYPIRPGVISSIGEHRGFSASFLASPSSKPDLPGRLLQNKHKTLTRAHSDSQAVYFKTQGILSPDRDSQLIGVTTEYHLGPQCVIRRKINFEGDDAFIKTFQLYWYVDAAKGCLESPILSANNKRIHTGSPIEQPYFVITKNQRRHQAYSCTFCKGKTTFISIIQALRHLKANHRHNIKIIIQDPNGVFNIDSTRPSTNALANALSTTASAAAVAAAASGFNPHKSGLPSIGQLQLPWPLPRPLGAPFSSTTASGLTIPGLTSGLLPSIPTIPTTSPFITPLRNIHREVSRTTSEIPPDAIDDTNRLTSDNIVYLKEILSRKLEKHVVECTPRGGSEVNVIFTDNTSRVVKLANENQSLKDKPRFDATLDYSQKHKPLLRTMSERTHSDHGRFMNSDSLKRARLDTVGITNDYYQAPSKSKYAAKMEYIKQKNQIDQAKTSFVCTKTTRSEEENADDEVRRLNKEMEVQSHLSDSTVTVDIDHVSNDSKKIDSEDSPSLHGKSVSAEASPMLTICDYQKGIISEQAMFKLKVNKPKLDSKKINITVAEGVIKMDSATQNQYYDSFAKIQVLATSFRCKICSFMSHSETEMSEHITEHSLKELTNFN